MIPRKISRDALRVFESAARHLSFTKAGAELNMTQGAVSQRIKHLESSLGATLFRRLPRALALSPDADMPRACKIVGGVSLFTWFAVLYCGRMLPYLGTGN